MKHFIGAVILSIVIILGTTFVVGCVKDKFVGSWEAYEISYMGRNIPVPGGKTKLFDITRSGEDYVFSEHGVNNRKILKHEGRQLEFRETTRHRNEILSTFTIDDKTGILNIESSGGGRTILMHCRRLKK